MSVSCGVSSDMKINDDLVMDKLCPQTVTTTSLSTEFTAAGNSSISDVTVSRVFVPLQIHQIHSGPVTSDHSMPATAPPCLPAYIPPSCSSVQQAPRLIATVPHERLVARHDQLLLLPPCTAMQPHQRVKLPPPLREQFPGTLPGQLPRGFSAPPVNVCHKRVPEMLVSPTPVPPPMEFCRRFPPPSNMAWHKSCSQTITTTTTSLSIDVTTAGVTVSQVPVAVQTCKIQPGLASAMLPQRPGMMPPALNEQLTPFPDIVAGDLPRVFSVPPVNVSHISRPVIPMNPAPVPMPGRFPSGLSEPSPAFCQEAHPALAINSASDQLCRQRTTTTLLSTNITTGTVNNIPDVPVNVLQAPVLKHTHQVQEGLCVGSYCEYTSTSLCDN